MESAEKAAAGWVRALDLSKLVVGAPRIYAGEERFSAGNAKGSFSVAQPGRAECRASGARITLGIGSQPCRAGLKFGNGPPGRSNADGQ
jgi:hypothetical protein